MHGQGEGFRKAFRVEETGLCVWQEEPWLAASPDGVVSEGDGVGALEIKCCKAASHMYSVDNIPPVYFDQMQGEMVILSSALGSPVLWCDFWVWSPDRRRCARVWLDREYFFGRVLPRLRAFYFRCYVPVARGVALCASGSDLRKGARRLTKANERKRSVSHVKRD